MTSTPIPFGPRILCAPRLRVSPSLASTGTLPQACTASTCRSAPCSAASRRDLRRRLQHAGLGVHRLHRDEARRPLPQRAAQIVQIDRSRLGDGQPARPSRGPRARGPRRHASPTGARAGYEPRRGLPPACPANAERSAMLFASVPPDVSTTSRGSTPPSAATASRTSSTRARAARPCACTLDGLPQAPLPPLAHRVDHVGSGGVVAFQSR